MWHCATVGPGLLHLRLYVAGDAPNSVAAIANLGSLLAETAAKTELEIIDLLVDPTRGLRDSVLVTPTLLRVSPPPVRRVLGNLRDRAALMRALGLDG